MKNLMNTITLMVVLVMGAVSANANGGILLSDRSVNTDVPCKTEIKFDSGIIVAGIVGIIVAGRDGIIVAGRDGIIVAGKSGDGCQDQSRAGILLSD